VLLIDRRLTGVEVLRVLREGRVHYCTLIRCTDNVVNAIEENAAGTRERVSTVAMESKGSCEHYTVIVPRRDSGTPTREGLVVFAVSAPWVDVEWYAKRWGIETGTASWRGRGSGRRPQTRRGALCLAYSLIMPSAWATAMAMAGMASLQAAKWARITHSRSRDVGGAMADRGTRLPEPPPGPP